MKKLTHVMTETARRREFTLSNNSTVRLQLGNLSDQEARETVWRLRDFALFIFEHSDKDVQLTGNNIKLESELYDNVWALNRAGYKMEYFLRLGSDVISEKRLRELVDPEFVSGELWDGYTVEELEGQFTGIAVCGVFLRYDDPADPVVADQKLILMNMHFDNQYAEDWQVNKLAAHQKIILDSQRPRPHEMTQVRAVKDLVGSDFGPELEQDSVTYRDVLSMYLMSKHAGIGTAPYGTGSLALVSLPRGGVVGETEVPELSSPHGRLGLYASRGLVPSEGTGVSLLAGLKNQA
ncbi:hypothetical protein FWF93_03145 [Candidatus Saccharibacteria bacterium]|nr:hypothetical protein [Candidatus Saccharibacteria bacterium]